MKRSSFYHIFVLFQYFFKKYYINPKENLSNSYDCVCLHNRCDRDVDLDMIVQGPRAVCVHLLLLVVTYKSPLAVKGGSRIVLDLEHLMINVRV